MTYLAFSPDGTRLAVVLYTARDAGVPLKGYVEDASCVVSILDTATLGTSSVVQREFKEGMQGPLWVFAPSIAFSTDNTQLYVFDSAGRQMRTWDLAARQWSRQRAAREIDAPAFGFSATGDRPALYWSDVNGKWKVGSEMRDYAKTKAGWPLCFSADGKRFLKNGKDGVQAWDVMEEKPLCTLHENADPLDRVTSAALSPDGDTVAFRCMEGLHSYCISTSEERVILPEYFEVHRDKNGWGTRSRSGDATFGIAFSRDGQTLAAWGEYGLIFFDTSRNFRAHVRKSEPIRHFVFAPDAKKYATAERSGRVAIWDIATGRELRSTTLRGDVQ